MVMGAVWKGRGSSRRINALLRQLTALPLDAQLTIEIVWVPTWANSGGAPSRATSLEDWLQEERDNTTLTGLPRGSAFDSSPKGLGPTSRGPLNSWRILFVTCVKVVC